MPSTTTPGERAGGSPAGGPDADGARADEAGTGVTRAGGAGPRRRSVLAGTAGALLAGGAVAGCTDDGESPAERRRRIDEATRLRREAARDSETLLTRYTGTAVAHPALDGRLAPLREAVARHVEAFGGTVRGAGDGDGVGSGGEGTLRKERKPGASGPEDAPGGGPAAGNHMAVPGDEGRALAALADAERRTADARTRALVDAPPELARLLASVAAAGSTHAFLLTQDTA